MQRRPLQTGFLQKLLCSQCALTSKNCFEKKLNLSNIFWKFCPGGAGGWVLAQTGVLLWLAVIDTAGWVSVLVSFLAPDLPVQKEVFSVFMHQQRTCFGEFVCAGLARTGAEFHAIHLRNSLCLVYKITTLKYFSICRRKSTRCCRWVLQEAKEPRRDEEAKTNCGLFTQATLPFRHGWLVHRNCWTEKRTRMKRTK